MTGILLNLKRLLNTMQDYEIADMELWIDNESNVELIAMDNDAITLITDKAKLKINDMEW